MLSYCESHRHLGGWWGIYVCVNIPVVLVRWSSLKTSDLHQPIWLLRSTSWVWGRIGWFSLNLRCVIGLYNGVNGHGGGGGVCVHL